MKSIKLSALLGVLTLASAAMAHAGTITSDNFSISEGYVNPGVFDTSETSSVNVGPGANFTIDPSVIAAALSSTGFTFTNGVFPGPGTNASGGSYSAYVDPTFSLTLTGTYTGPTPVDAAAIPNYQLTINVTSIQIHAAAFSNGTLGWTETTAGNTQAQTPVSIAVAPQPNWLYSDNYSDVNFDAGSLTTAGTSQARTFGLAQTWSDSAYANGNFAIDGFVVTGNEVLTYDSVAAPEPSTFALLAAGVVFAVVAVRLRRRSALVD